MPTNVAIYKQVVNACATRATRGDTNNPIAAYDAALAAAWQYILQFGHLHDTTFGLMRATLNAACDGYLASPVQ